MKLKYRVKPLSHGVVVNIVLVLTVALVVTAVLADGGYIDAFAGSNAIYKGNENEPCVALMFNVYGGTEYIEGILKVLENEGVTCTFFLGGSWVAKNPTTAKSIATAGQEIGSHGYHHFNHTSLTEKQNIDEISVAEKQIQATVGIAPSLFAPPSGDVSDKVVRCAESLGYKVIMWSKDTIDWRDKDSDLVFQRATNGISNGDLILMHPTAHTLEALPKIIRTIKANGLNPTIVSKVISNANAM